MEPHWPALRVYLHLTRDCNLRCTYCYGGEKLRDRMSLETAARAVDYFLEHTVSLQVCFFGGEPLLEFPVLQRAVEHAERAAARRGAALDLLIVTNGTLLTRDVVQFCADHKVDYSLSLDGNHRAHDAGRLLADGRGSFRQIESNFDHILAANPYVHVVCVVHPGNIAYLEESFDYLVGRGFRTITLNPDFTHPQIRDFLPAVARSYEALGRRYYARLRRGERIFVNIFDDGSCPYMRRRCRFGDGDFSVAPSGRIYPCTAFADHDADPLGDVDGGLDLGRLAGFREELARLDEEIAEHHRDCPPESLCRNYCGCANLVLAGHLATVPPVVCEYSRLLAEVRGRLLQGLAVP